MESVSPEELPPLVINEQPAMDTTEGESSNDIRNLSEEDLMKLKKINFKKKVSGNLKICSWRFSYLIFFLFEFRKRETSSPEP